MHGYHAHTHIHAHGYYVSAKRDVQLVFLFSFFFSNCVCVAYVALSTFPNQIFPKILSQMHEKGVTSILKCNQICIRFNYVDFGKTDSEYSFIEIIFEKNV